MGFVRRAILVLGLLIGFLLFAWPVPHLFRVESVDWDTHRQQKERRAKRLAQMASDTLGRDVSGETDVYPETRLDREAYIAHETQGRLADVEGAAWRAFFTSVTEAVPVKGSLYSRPDDAPLASLVDRFNDFTPVLYVRIQGQARADYLRIHLLARRDLLKQAPPSLLFPFRSLGSIVMLSALLFYILLPRKP